MVDKEADGHYLVGILTKAYLKRFIKTSGNCVNVCEKGIICFF